MEKIVDFITDNFTMSVLVLIGIVSPGILTMAKYGLYLFDKWDIIKILVFACSITAPPASVIYVAVKMLLIRDKDKNEYAVMFSLAFNAVIFICALGICYFNGSELKDFIMWFIVVFIIAIIMLYIDNKRETHKEKKIKK